ncbi:YeeE/YedE family protein [Pseudomonas sp. G34]|uniref:YeeE/YedE family protein n=1 Tax=Pseudomonas sp. G34 TaxID=3059083 RepID=UPI002806FD08|nr:YeeE/YedE family protein [Pseudomonas sp. G34]MDQ7987366.1 YeeE/YedE family protein [Pseudomonas sp. G34]
MSIDWNSFTPWASLGGGALIGLAVSVFMVVNGRIAGISGLLAAALQRGSDGWSEKVCFLLGLLLAPLLWGAFAALPEIAIDSGWPALILAGVLVGVGVRYGSGCTSGHGVCGISRLAPRSLVATVCFMATGFATVYLIRHVLGA